MLPSGRSLTMLRKEGWRVAVVEKQIAGTLWKKDVFGFGDILAIHDREKRILLVQTTTLSNVPARLTKATATLELTIWLNCGGSFEVHGWHRQAGVWRCKRVAVSPDDCEPVVIASAPRRRSKGKWQPKELF